MDASPLNTQRTVLQTPRNAAELFAEWKRAVEAREVSAEGRYAEIFLESLRIMAWAEKMAAL